MKIEDEEVFVPFKICIETEKELRESVGVLDKVYASDSDMIDTLHKKLRDKLGVPMLGLYKGRLDRNL